MHLSYGGYLDISYSGGRKNMSEKIEVICCVCGKYLGEKNAGKARGGVSHAFCKDCLEAWRQEQLQYIQERKKQCQ